MIGKKISKPVSVLIILLVALTVLSGCGKTKKDVEQGTFADNTYINSELGIKVTLPDGWTADTREQLDSYENPDIALKYDAFFRRDDASITVGIDLLKNMFANSADVTIADYLGILRSDVKKLKLDGTEIGEDETCIIAGQEGGYLRIYYSEENILQEYYVIRSEDNYMVVIIATYKENQAPYISEIMAAFEAA